MVGLEITFIFYFWADLVKKAQEQSLEMQDRRVPEASEHYTRMVGWNFC